MVRVATILLLVAVIFAVGFIAVIGSSLDSGAPGAVADLVDGFVQEATACSGCSGRGRP